MSLNTASRFKPRTLAPYVVILILGAAMIYLVTSRISHEAQAAPVTGFNPGLIMDDSVFANRNSMSAGQIQTFLDSKVPICDTYGTQASEFGGGTRAQWAAARGYSPPFTCLKDFSEGGRTTAQIIYDTSQEFSINPQILLVLLQKEQVLVTDTWPIPNSSQYKTATGYGCPDTAACDAQYYGLTNQLRWSATMFRAILNNSPNWYTPYVLGNNYIQWSPNSACGGSTVNIQNRATQALYNYTPYQPNQASLNSWPGSGDGCSAYGNRNFYQYFKEWFGSTTGPEYSGSLNSVTLYSDSNYSLPIAKIGSRYILQPSQTVYARTSVTNNGRTTWDGLTNLGTSRPNDRTSPFYSSSWVNQQRPARATGTPTSPYSDATFSFQLTSPIAPGIFSEGFAMVQDGVAWMNTSFTIDIQVANPAPAPLGYTDNILAPNTTLAAGQSLISPDGYTSLSLSADGVLQLRRDYQPVWTPGVSAGTGGRLVMQADGNLVLYRQSGAAVWHTVTSGQGSSKLYVQEDGNLVIYRDSGGSTWSSGTSLNGSHYLYPTISLGNNGVLVAGQAVRSADRRYNLYLQTDGNLVLYSPSRAIWASNTSGRGGARLVMQGDGNLVLYSQSGQALWYSGTAGRGQSTLFVQQDGNLVVYGAQGPTWSSRTDGQQ